MCSRYKLWTHSDHLFILTVLSQKNKPKTRYWLSSPPLSSVPLPHLPWLFSVPYAFLSFVQSLNFWVSVWLMESERRIYKDRQGRVQRKRKQKLKVMEKKVEMYWTSAGSWLSINLSLCISHSHQKTSDTLKCVNLSLSFHIISVSVSQLCLLAVYDKSMVLLRFQMWWGKLKLCLSCIKCTNQCYCLWIGLGEDLLLGHEENNV